MQCMFVIKWTAGLCTLLMLPISPHARACLLAAKNKFFMHSIILHTCLQPLCMKKQCWLTLLILSPTQNTSNIGELVKHDQCIPPPAGGQKIQVSLQGNLKLQCFTLSLMHLVTFGILTFGILTFGILTFVTFVAT